MIRGIGHRIKDADGIVVGMMDEPVPSPTELGRELSVASDRDAGFVGCDGAAIRLDDFVLVMGEGEYFGQVGKASRTERTPDGAMVHVVSDEAIRPAWKCWCLASELKRITSRRAKSIRRASQGKAIK